MPCVLPVIGLKVMSFVKESDRSGSSIIALNLWYIAGIMTVFLVLAAFTIGFREIQGEAFGWGEQFGSTPLRIGLTVLMFAMALSFLGVWEIPIPGFATSQTSNEMMQREGPFGAYSKGLLTTVLATPCSGPGLAAAFAVAISQPAWVIVLMYVGVGLGMSLPFIVICLSPQLVKYVPKPGPWMQSLKEFLAFPMLFAIVWLFLTTFNGETLIAVILTLIAVWFACWWIGRVPVWSGFGKKALHWTGAIATAVCISWFAFRIHGEHEKLIKWIPYSASQLAELDSQNKTVMIDFTAQWCANCKVNLLTAIETDEVADLVIELGIVPMLADFTDRPPDIKQKLHELESNSIPILAILPAGRHHAPIVLRDLVTKSAVLAALRKAAETSNLSANSDREHGLPVRVSTQAPP
jgi:thiol:disulfide interchange protein